MRLSDKGRREETREGGREYTWIIFCKKWWVTATAAVALHSTLASCFSNGWESKNPVRIYLREDRETEGEGRSARDRPRTSYEGRKGKERRQERIRRARESDCHPPGIVEDYLYVDILGGGDDLGKIGLAGGKEGPDGAELLLCFKGGEG